METVGWSGRWAVITRRYEGGVDKGSEWLLTWGHDTDRSADERRGAPRAGARGGGRRVRRPGPGRNLDRGRRAGGRDQPALPVPAVPHQEGAVPRARRAVLPACRGR